MSALTANAGLLASATLATFVTAKLLGAAGRGEIALATVAGSFAAVAWSFSLETGILSTGSVSTRNNQVLRSLIVPLMSMYVLCTATLWFATLALDLDLGAPFVMLYALGYSAVVVVPALASHERLHGRENSAVWWPAAILSSQQLLGLLAVIAEPTASNYIAASSVASLMTTCAFAIRSLSRAETAPVDRMMSAGEVLNLVRYSLSGHWGVLLHLFCMRSPVVLAGVFLGESAAGILSIAVALGEVSLIVSQSQLGWVLRSSLTNRFDFAPLVQQLKVCAGLTVALLSFLSGVVLFVPKIVGADFGQSVGIFVILAPGMVAVGLWRLAAYDLATRGHATLRTTSAGVGSIVAAAGGGMAVLLGSLHLLAASISVTYFTMLVSLYLAARRGRVGTTTSK